MKGQSDNTECSPLYFIIYWSMVIDEHISSILMMQVLGEVELILLNALLGA